MAALGGAMLFAGLPSTAQAQNDDKRIDTLGLHLTAGLDLLYDDNVYRVDDRVEDPTGDLIVTPSIEATYAHPIGRHDIQLRAKAGYDQFVSETQRSKL